jgi:hypothetical protein
VTADDVHCNEAGQEYCEKCADSTELWLFGTVIDHSLLTVNVAEAMELQYCESCMVVTVDSESRYCEGCINDIVKYLAASYIATDSLYFMQVEDKYNEMLLSSEYGGNYNVQSEAK